MKKLFWLFVAAAAIFLVYKFLIVRTVYYEIGGIKIPSRYNIITGTAKPIQNYKGPSKLRTVETKKTAKMGLTEEEVVMAKLRWAIFEEWANTKPEYKGWDKSPAIFKKANEAFLKEMKKSL